MDQIYQFIIVPDCRFLVQCQITLCSNGKSQTLEYKTITILEQIKQVSKSKNYQATIYIKSEHKKIQSVAIKWYNMECDGRWLIQSG